MNILCARAIIKAAADSGRQTAEVSQFKALPGNGLSAVLNGKELYGGNHKFISNITEVPAGMARQAEELAASGKTLCFSQLEVI